MGYCKSCYFAKAFFQACQEILQDRNVGHSARKIGCISSAQTLTLSSIEIRPYHFCEMVTETACIDFGGSQSTSTEERRDIDKK